MNVKMVIVVRKDLNMRKGKIAAQVAHASMKVFFDRMNPIQAVNESTYSALIRDITPAMKIWMEESFTKVVVGCKSKGELISLKVKADGLGIPNALMIDNGWTEFHNTPTITCLAIGPDDSDKIDEVTKDLQLI